MELDLEKEKLRYAHKLETRRLLLDKALFGVIVIVVGVFANVLFERYKSNLERDRSLFFEEYKDKLVQDRFLLEKRLEAVNAIKEAFSQMQELFMDYTDTRGNPNDYAAKNQKAVDNYLHATNQWGIAVSEEFSDKTQSILWIYQGFHDRDVAQCADYRAFAVDLHDYFESSCRIELGIPYKSNKSVFSLMEMDWHRAESLGAEGVLDFHYERWKEWSNSLKPTPK